MKFNYKALKINSDFEVCARACNSLEELEAFHSGEIWYRKGKEPFKILKFGSTICPSKDWKIKDYVVLIDVFTNQLRCTMLPYFSENWTSQTLDYVEYDEPYQDEADVNPNFRR